MYAKSAWQSGDGAEKRNRNFEKDYQWLVSVLQGEINQKSTNKHDKH